MVYLNCNMIPNVNFAPVAGSRANDLGIWEICYKSSYIEIKVKDAAFATGWLVLGLRHVPLLHVL